jgi:hypothetical protein
VGDEEHRALEVREGLQERLLGGEVEVVGRLVEHEEVRRVVEHLGEHQPRLLAAREHPAGLLHVVAREPEGPREAAQRAQ